MYMTEYRRSSINLYNREDKSTLVFDVDAFNTHIDVNTDSRPLHFNTKDVLVQDSSGNLVNILHHLHKDASGNIIDLDEVHMLLEALKDASGNAINFINYNSIENSLKDVSGNIIDVSYMKYQYDVMMSEHSQMTNDIHDLKMIIQELTADSMSQPEPEPEPEPQPEPEPATSELNYDTVPVSASQFRYVSNPATIFTDPTRTIEHWNHRMIDVNDSQLLTTYPPAEYDFVLLQVKASATYSSNTQNPRGSIFYSDYKVVEFGNQTKKIVFLENAGYSFDNVKIKVIKNDMSNADTVPWKNGSSNRGEILGVLDPATEHLVVKDFGDDIVKTVWFSSYIYGVSP